MRATLAGAVAAIAAGGAVVLVERNRQRSASQAGPSSGSEPRWHSVTVDRPREELWPDGRVPAPLAALGSSVEIELHDAPGDKGTEIRARLQAGADDGRSPRGRGESREERVRRLRRALREAKQLVEVGEVLRVDPTPHGRRARTPLGAVVEVATDRAPEEGLL